METVYLVMRVGWEYNDNWWEPVFESEYPTRTFLFKNRKRAEEECRKLTLERFRNSYNLGLYRYNEDVWKDNGINQRQINKLFGKEIGLFNIPDEELQKLDDEQALQFLRIMEIKFFYIIETEIKEIE